MTHEPAGNPALAIPAVATVKVRALGWLASLFSARYARQAPRYGSSQRVKHSRTAPSSGSRASALRKTRLRVRYADTDRMGVVYYANYLVWFEVGRTEWLRESGWCYRDMEAGGIGLPVIEAHCEYLKPARYDDEVEIATRATLLTPVRVRFDYEVTRAGDGTLSATGHTVHAAVDDTGKPCRLPARVREILG